MPGAARLAAVARHLVPTPCHLSPAPAAETAAEQPAVGAASIDAAVEQIRTEGFYVWPGFIGGARLAQLSEDCDRLLHPIENQPGLDGEPMSSRMKKQLLPDTRCMDDLFLDPTLHAIVGGVFAGRGFRIGLTQSMIKDVLRGEDIRSMHQDDGIYLWRDGLARPLVAVASINRMAGRGADRGPRRSSVAVRSRRLGAIRSAATSIPGDVGSARRRRRDLMCMLVGMAVFTLLGGVAVGGVVWIVHFLVDLLLVGYAVLVTQRHQLEAERRETIIPFRMDGPLMGGLSGSSAMRDEAVLSRRAN